MTDESGIRRLIEAWEAGAITDTALVSHVVELAAAADVAVLPDVIPPVIVSQLRQCVVAAPVTDAQWERMTVVESHCGTEAPSETVRRHEAELKHFRAGVEKLRGWFESQGDGNGEDRNSG